MKHRSTTRPTPVFSLPLLAPVLAACLLAGCGDGPPAEGLAAASPAPVPSTTTSALTLAASTGTVGSYGPGGGTARVDVGKMELDCADQDFNDRIHLGTPASHAPIPLPTSPLRFPAQDLKDHLPSTCGTGSEEQYGVLVHFGLTTDKVLDLALEIVCLKYDAEYDGYRYASTGEYLVVRDEKLESDGGNTLKDWYGPTGAGTRYAKSVVIDAGDGTYAPFQWGRDVLARAYPYQSELELLIAQNAVEGQETMVELVPIATPGSWMPIAPDESVEFNYGQGLAWCVNRDSIVDTPANPDSLRFKHRAADLGSPCPPNTLVFKFAALGVPARPYCK